MSAAPAPSFKSRMDLQVALARRQMGVKNPAGQISRRNLTQAPLSFAQQRLWFIDQLEPGNPIYNIPGGIRLTGPLDQAALRSALTEIVRRHEALRTTFATVDGTPAQVIHPAGEFDLPVIDLRHLPHSERDQQLAELRETDKQKSFDLQAGPLIRASLILLKPDEYVLPVTMHHIISDGLSRGRFFSELAVLYGAFRRGEPSPLPDLAIQYADYSAWQRERLQGGILDQHLAYWRTALAGAPPLLELPTDRPRESAAGYHGSLERFTIAPKICAKLRAICSESSSTLFMLLTAAICVVLGRHSGQQDIVVGTDEGGRHQKETEPLIGFFINHLVLRMDLSGNPSFRELLDRARRTTVEAYAHQELPFDRLVEEMRPERKSSHSPMFQVLLVMLPPMAESEFGCGLNVSPANTGIDSCKYEMTLFFRDSTDGLTVGWLYRTALYDQATIRAMASDLQAVVEQVAASPAILVGELRTTLLELAGRRATQQRDERREATRARLRGNVARRLP